MAKKLYEEASVQDIAVAIREKNGETTTYKIGEMGAAVRALSGSEAIEWHQCPEVVRNYLANATYDPSDYSTSQIATYAPATAVASNTKPIGKTVGGTTYYNEAPNKLTPFAGDSAAGTLKPLDALRWLNTPQAQNVRDLGGWACDGGTVRYGLLIRGGEVTSADRDVLVGECGVRHDLNLRGTEEANRTTSPLGSDIWFTCPKDYVWYSLNDKATWKEILDCVITAVTHSEPVYFHCSVGADRTGTVACILEGLLGMSQSDIDKDYELTCFSTGTDTDNHARRRNESDWQGLISQISQQPGDTFRDKVVNFVTSCGFPISRINDFRKAMSTGTPEVLTGVTYTITNTLTHVTTNNSATSIENQASYTAVLTPETDYAIKSVAITMGGADISNCYVGGTITIPAVTGDIAITAVAEQIVYTNLFDKSKCTVNKRFSGGTNEVSANGYYITDYMAVSAGDSIKWTGALNSTQDKIAFYDSSKTALGYAYLYTTKVSSGSNPATYFDGNLDSGYINKIGYVWTGAYSDTAKAPYFDNIAYVRINSFITKGTAIASTSDIPDHTFVVMDI